MPKGVYKFHGTAAVLRIIYLTINPYLLPVTFSASTSPISLVKLAQNLIEGKIKSGDIVIDATLGNGHDTSFLLDLIKPSGKVFAFDIQQVAIDSAKMMLKNHSALNCLTLLLENHQSMIKTIPPHYHGKIAAIMFNLGYLPGGNKHIITHADSTLKALAVASRLLAAGGIITILAYPGHEGGETETSEVKSWCHNLDPVQFQFQVFSSPVDHSTAPKLFVIQKTSPAKATENLLLC